jgi:hypothetical protein
VPRHVEAIPSPPKESRLQRGCIRDLDDEAAAWSKKLRHRMQSSSRVGDVFQEVKHGYEVEEISAPGIAPDFALPHLEIVLSPRNLRRPRRRIQTMREESTSPREVKKRAAATSNVEQPAAGTGPFAPSAAFDKANVIEINKSTIRSFKPGRKSR